MQYIYIYIYICIYIIYIYIYNIYIYIKILNVDIFLEFRKFQNLKIMLMETFYNSSAQFMK